MHEPFWYTLLGTVGFAALVLFAAFVACVIGYAVGSNGGENKRTNKTCR
jgi:hypothetical protein